MITFSKAKRFAEKATDVVPVQLNSPNKATVLSVEEKSQVQVLDRTQPALPINKRLRSTMSHSNKHHPTIWLFAALDTLDGKAVGICYPGHRPDEFLKSLGKIGREMPSGTHLPLILDKCFSPRSSQGKASGDSMSSRKHC
jgi:hypothetical protein